MNCDMQIITFEQLDEIEKLAEAATPGPWNHSFEFIHPQDGGISDAFIVCRHTEGGYDAAFLCEMREHALPLVKALREARDERDVLQAVLNDWQRFGMEREKERDEALAEAERLREIVKTAGDRLRACGYRMTEQVYQEMADALFDLPASAEVAP